MKKRKDYGVLEMHLPDKVISIPVLPKHAVNETEEINYKVIHARIGYCWVCRKNIYTEERQ